MFRWKKNNLKILVPNSIKMSNNLNFFFFCMELLMVNACLSQIKIKSYKYFFVILFYILFCIYLLLVYRYLHLIYCVEQSIAFLNIIKFRDESFY